MGLLDDAIREHLELKRSRGSDPSEVARKEREALGPIDQETEPAAHAHSEPEESAGSSDPGEEPYSEPSFPPSSTGQETVELDMDSVLQRHRDAEAAESASGGEPHTGHRSPPGLPAEDSLEWEVPSESIDQGELEDPGDSGNVEDVLEETPDFLRDTPEQERLWFEQRPPRDFDFDD